MDGWKTIAFPFSEYMLYTWVKLESGFACIVTTKGLTMTMKRGILKGSCIDLCKSKTKQYIIYRGQRDSAVKDDKTTCSFNEILPEVSGNDANRTSASVL